MDIVLNVAELFGSPSALTREQGAIVFDKIVPLLKEGKKVVLDFGEIASATIRSGGGSSSASESWTFWYHGS